MIGSHNEMKVVKSFEVFFKVLRLFPQKSEILTPINILAKTEKYVKGCSNEIPDRKKMPQLLHAQLGFLLYFKLCFKSLPREHSTHLWLNELVLTRVVIRKSENLVKFAAIADDLTPPSSNKKIKENKIMSLSKSCNDRTFLFRGLGEMDDLVLHSKATLRTIKPFVTVLLELWSQPA